MWINPNHPDYERLTRSQPPRTEPPPATGRHLAALDRSSQENGDDQLRVVLDEFQGHPYISIRLWHKDHNNAWWPVKGKGISVRLREAESVADALREAVELAGGGSAPAAGQGGRRPTRGQQSLSEATAGGGFDEFEGG